MPVFEIEPVAPVLVTHPNPFALEALVKRERARHAMRPLTPVSQVQPGVYGCWVEQYKPIRPVWVRPVAMGAGGVLVLGGLAAAGWFLMGVLVGLLPVGLGALAVAGAVRLLVRRPGCTITITHRH